MKSDNFVRKSLSEITNLLVSLLEKNGYTHKEACLIYPEFIENEVLKNPEQGLDLFIRILHYDAKKRKGKTFLKTTRGITTLDCGGKFIYPQLDKALNILEHKAKKEGIHLLAIKNNTCFIKAGFPVYKLVQKNLIALCCVFVNFPKASPEGVGTPVFGTNPISFGVPYGSHDFFIFDTSTTNMSYSKFKKIQSDSSSNKEVLGQNRKGELTKLAQEITALLPFGGNRGLGFPMFVEFLAGSMLGYKIGRLRTNIDDSGVIIVAINPSFFIKFRDFTSKNNAFIQDLKKLSKQKVHIAGEKYHLLSVKRKALSIKKTTWLMLQKNLAQSA